MIGLVCLSIFKILRGKLMEPSVGSPRRSGYQYVLKSDRELVKMVDCTS